MEKKEHEKRENEKKENKVEYENMDGQEEEPSRRRRCRRTCTRRHRLHHSLSQSSLSHPLTHLHGDDGPLRRSGVHCRGSRQVRVRMQPHTQTHTHTHTDSHLRRGRDSKGGTCNLRHSLGGTGEAARVGRCCCRSLLVCVRAW
eukprot:GHVU01175278.1.p1 GENE.GHVU01175278.1~~GHVU01175278.1.p1  ORF type:complete len:155 (+),score=32.12 GHVU01175278.1:35-466(+)